MGIFAEFVPLSGDPSMSPNDYLISSINDIGIRAIFGEEDQQCPIDENLAILTSIPNFVFDTIPAAVNNDLVFNNDAGFFNLLLAGLPDVAIPIDVVELCPVQPEDPEPECMEATDREFRFANRRMRRVKKSMIRYDIWSVGNPDDILHDLEKCIKMLQYFCIDHEPMETWIGYDTLMADILFIDEEVEVVEEEEEEEAEEDCQNNGRGNDNGKG